MRKRRKDSISMFVRKYNSSVLGDILFFSGMTIFVSGISLYSLYLQKATVIHLFLFVLFFVLLVASSQRKIRRKDVSVVEKGVVVRRSELVSTIYFPAGLYDVEMDNGKTIKQINSLPVDFRNIKVGDEIVIVRLKNGKMYGCLPGA